MGQELVPGRGGLRAERGDDRGAGGAVLDRHAHPRALPGLRENLFSVVKEVCSGEHEGGKLKRTNEGGETRQDKRQKERYLEIRGRFLSLVFLHTPHDDQSDCMDFMTEASVFQGGRPTVFRQGYLGRCS